MLYIKPVASPIASKRRSENRLKPHETTLESTTYKPRISEIFRQNTLKHKSKKPYLFPPFKF